MSKQLSSLLVCTSLVCFATEKERTWADGPVVPRTSPTPEVSAELQKLSNGKLIDRFIHRVMLETPFSQYSADLIPVDKRSNRPTGARKPETPKAYAVMAELIRRGGKALPDLAERVTDKRETDFVVGGEDIDGRRAYRLRVGDLCFEVIGKIVDQPMKAVSYSGGGPFQKRVVNSPVRTPKLAKQVQKDWGKVSQEEFKAYLVERSSKFARWHAWHKLQFYYPESAEDIAVQLLCRPTYDKSKLWSFIKNDLVAEGDPNNWKIKIDNYVRENGDHLSRQIPYWMHWIYGGTELAATETFLAKQKNAKEILRTLYPEFERTGQARSEAADLGDHKVALFSLRNVPSKKIDAQVFSMLQDALKLELSEKEEYKLAFFASECLKRLYGQNYHADGRADALFNLCNAIIVKENSSDPIFDKEDSKNHYMQRVVLSFLVKYEPKKSRQLFADFQSSDKAKTLSEKLTMLSEPTTIEPWMLDFLKAQLGNKQPVKVRKEGLGQQHSVRFCDLAAQIIANHYLETTVQLELNASPAHMDGQIAKIKRALSGEKDNDFSPPKSHQRD